MIPFRKKKSAPNDESIACKLELNPVDIEKKKKHQKIQMSYLSVGPPNKKFEPCFFPIKSRRFFFQDVNTNIQLTTGYPSESPDCCAIEFVVGKPWL